MQKFIHIKWLSELNLSRKTYYTIKSDENEQGKRKETNFDGRKKKLWL